MASRKALARKYTPAEVDRALLAYAVEGNFTRSTHVLKATGLDVPRSTLRHWVNDLYRERYIELSNEHAPQFLETQKARLREVLAESAEATLEGIRASRSILTKLDPRDRAGAARNLATVHGIASDKLAALENRPVAVMDHNLNADDLLRKIQSYGIDWKPEPITDAEVVEEA